MTEIISLFLSINLIYIILVIIIIWLIIYTAVKTATKNAIIEADKYLNDLKSGKIKTEKELYEEEMKNW